MAVGDGVGIAEGVGVGVTSPGRRSNAPMSQAAPCERATQRWSVAGQLPESALSTAWLAGPRACVWVGPLTNTGILGMVNVRVTDGESCDAIYNGGDLTLSDTTVQDTDNDLSQGIGFGIRNFGRVTLSRSRVVSFYAGPGCASDDRFGGAAIVNGAGSFISSTPTPTPSASSGPSLAVLDSEISNNRANTGANTGSAILNFGAAYVVNSTITRNGNTEAVRTHRGTMAVLNSTIHGNGTGDLVGSGAGGSVTVRNSIVGSCATFGTVTSLGGNIDQGDACGFRSAGDQVDTDPRLLPLAYNGGTTRTLALAPDSPAVDRADDSACPPADQRGVVRPQGAGCDVGAFERRAEEATPVPPTPTPTPSPTAVPTPPPPPGPNRLILPVVPEAAPAG